MLYSKKFILNLINTKKITIKKKYGQNFIIDENIINNIIEKSKVNEKTMVLEIGPGIGSLTYKLASKCQNILCYEIDGTLKENLEENLKQYNNVVIKYEDFLKASLKNEISKYNYDKLYVIANLPYYITTPIIMKLIDENIKFDKIIIMVQKEVGNRLKAKPKTKDYNSLSIFINYYFDVKKIMDVSRNVFIPVPNVDSIIMELVKNDKKYNVNNEFLFFKLVRDSFKQKRKTLKNNLKGYDIIKIEEILKRNKYSLQSRAEEIPIEVFVEISNYLGGE